MNRLLTSAVILVGLLSSSPAQKDMRDEVTLSSGRVIKGRLLNPYSEDEFIVMQGGKRVRLKSKNVSGTNILLDRQREFFLRRATLEADPEEHWKLSQWAQSVELWGLARLAAHQVLIMDPDHPEAHASLGHRKRGKRWLWPKDSKWLSLEKLEKDSSAWGRALEIDGEHFRIRSNGGIRRAVLALLDLERLYLYWFDQFGPELDLYHALEPMEVRVWNDEEKFPGWSSLRLSYFVPKPFDDAGFTFYPRGEERPYDLFLVGSQQILYRCLALDPNLGYPKNRLCAWLELGMGQWVQTQLAGKVGEAEPVVGRLDLEQARIVLIGERYSLKNILHLSLRDNFYGGLAGDDLTHWASVYCLVSYMMDEDARKGGRQALLEFLYTALREGKGDSSKAFDSAMGENAERIEGAWLSWLEKRAGMRRRR
ncbi:MAG: hypothetical protein ACYTG5_04530 [Planctomycetota bacterium]|jgi:hypothetical protein